MRLILLWRGLTRQLCHIGLHRWGRIREITGLDFKGTSLMPNGTLDLQFMVTGSRYAMKCQRVGCHAERGA